MEPPIDPLQLLVGEEIPSVVVEGEIGAPVPFIVGPEQIDTGLVGGKPLLAFGSEHELLVLVIEPQIPRHLVNGRYAGMDVVELHASRFTVLHVNHIAASDGSVAGEDDFATLFGSGVGIMPVG